MWMTSAGNDTMIAKAKATLTNAIIGLVITLSAYGLVRFVVESLAPTPPTEGVLGLAETWYNLIQLIS